MKDSDIIKELLVNAFGVREDQLELFARAIRAEMRQEKLPEAATTETAASEPKGRGGGRRSELFLSGCEVFGTATVLAVCGKS